MVNGEKDLKDLEKQIVRWSEQIENHEYEKATAEASVASYILIYNIDENISLIRDMLNKILKNKE